MLLFRQESVSGILLHASMYCILSFPKGLPKKLYAPKIIFSPAGSQSKHHRIAEQTEILFPEGTSPWRRSKIEFAHRFLLCTGEA